MVDSHGTRGKGARMHGLPLSALPFPLAASRAREDAKGDAGSSVDHQDPHPHGQVLRAGVDAAVGDRQGNVRGVGVLYKAGARGGEFSSSKRSVSVTSSYRTYTSSRTATIRASTSTTTSATRERAHLALAAHARTYTRFSASSPTRDEEGRKSSAARWRNRGRNGW